MADRVMRSPLITIDEVGGERAEMLFTPHLYAVARSRGVQITITDPKDADAVSEAYLKLAWLAHLNAVEVRRYGHTAGETVEPWQLQQRTLMDVTVWSQTDPKRYGEVVAAAVEMITGKSLAEIAAEGKKKLMTERAGR